jgi:hypothetical protein
MSVPAFPFCYDSKVRLGVSTPQAFPPPLAERHYFQVKDSLDGDYFWMTPQAIRAPELPEGSVIRSSACA